jgi:hypothetical protein
MARPELASYELASFEHYYLSSQPKVKDVLVQGLAGEMGRGSGAAADMDPPEKKLDLPPGGCGRAS